MRSPAYRPPRKGNRSVGLQETMAGPQRRLQASGDVIGRSRRLDGVVFAARSREVIGAYQRCAAETIGRFNGFVAKYMGDGVLAYFGYPQAHEDDAKRAVPAGLAVVDAVRRLPSREKLPVRIGLASGLAVVGDLIGSGAAQEEAVIGETPNVAARLQAVAGADEIVIPGGYAAAGRSPAVRPRRFVPDLALEEAGFETSVPGSPERRPPIVREQVPNRFPGA